MTRALNQTHDPALRSWVESANDPATDFPVQNLPFGVFRRRGAGGRPRVGVAIGDQILDVATSRRLAFLSAVADPCEGTTLNRLMAAGPDAWSALRGELSLLLRRDGPRARAARDATAEILVPAADAELLLPAEIGDYTDFYASVDHATNVGSMFRPDHPLLPNYKWIPIGYHGRASSIVVSGTPIRRPRGQVRPAEAPAPTVAPTGRLDYELELGCFIGPGNPLGSPIPLAHAEAHLFGLCLLNDWSARDVQAWEYQPLGPFLAKNFATSISPWIVTLEALAPFRVPAFTRAPGDPAPLPYLDDPDDRSAGGFDIALEVSLRTSAARAAGQPPVRLSTSRTSRLYWSFAQMLAHHSMNGCNLRPGDLLGSGTVSGPEREARGCLLELSWGGKEPVTLAGGETRTFLEDGDEVVFHGQASRSGAVRIGFGPCTGQILPVA